MMRVRPLSGSEVVLAAMCLLLVGGCAVPSIRGDVRALDVDAAVFYGGAWVEDDVIVLAHEASSEPGEVSHLVRIPPEGGTPVPLPFAESDDICWRIQEHRPTRLPDGRLGFLRECQPRAYEGVDFSIVWHDIVAANSAGGDQQVLRGLGDISWFGGVKPGLYAFSFTPDLREGVASLGSLVCDGVASIEASGIGPFDFVVSNGTSEANLNEFFTAECADTINARSIVWSPNGDHLAVLVAFDAKGVDGLARLNAEWDLLVLDPATGSSQVWARGMRNAGSVAWSPDGRWLLVEEASGSYILDTLDADHPRARLAMSDPISDVVDWAPRDYTLLGLVDPTPDGDFADREVVPATIAIEELAGGSASSRRTSAR
jgi:hypothetical protein